MSVTKLQIDTELHAAERALEAATERRRTAEHDLWEAVRSSGKPGRKWRRRERVDAARIKLAEAEEVMSVFKLKQSTYLNHFYAGYPIIIVS